MSCDVPCVHVSLSQLLSRSSTGAVLVPPSSSRRMGETLNGVLLHHIPAYARAKEAQLEQQLHTLATQQQHDKDEPEDTKHEHERQQEEEESDADDDGGPSYDDEPLEGY